MIPIKSLVPIALLMAAGCPKKPDAPGKSDTPGKSAPADLATRSAGMPLLPPLPQTPPLPSPADPSKFTFIAAGDNRPASKDNLKPEPTAQTIFNRAKALPAAFAFWAGDIILGKSPSDHSLLKKEYAEFFQIASTAGVPVFNAPGNHELDDADDVPNAQMQQWYEEIAKVPAYGAFTYGNSRFIGLNTEQVRDGSTADAGVSSKQRPDEEGDDEGSDPGHVTKEQRSALAADLEQSKNDAAIVHVFVFMHHPITPLKAKNGLDPKEAAELKALFTQYPKVHFVIAAHEHLYYNPLAPAFDPPSLTSPPSTTYPPPYYLVSGGAGAPSKTAGAHHYLVFAVNGAAVTVTKILLP
jgi:hypothetical protein